MRIKNEGLFRELSADKVEPNDEGRKQFYEQQSFGKKPDKSDRYYLSLVSGKWSFDYLTTQYKEMYFSDEWWGFYQLWKDWEGQRWVIPLLFPWHNKIPKWVSREVCPIFERIDL